jgi:hypothetical protein
MLFDLRGSGRRRTVRVIYATLAVLMGGGLIFFGVGGGVGGGLFDALSNNNGGGGSDVLAKEAKRLERRVATTPTDQRAWAQLAQTRFQDASGGDGFDQSTGAYSAAGKAKLRASTRAWERYLALDPAKPDYAVAAVMTQAYVALGRYAKATEAQEIVADTQPNAGTYAQLAQLAYVAHQTRKGDLAAAKAVALAPKDQRSTLKSELEAAKSQAAAATTQGADATKTTG